MFASSADSRGRIASLVSAAARTFRFVMRGANRCSQEKVSEGAWEDACFAQRGVDRIGATVWVRQCGDVKAIPGGDLRLEKFCRWASFFILCGENSSPSTKSCSCLAFALVLSI